MENEKAKNVLDQQVKDTLKRSLAALKESDLHLKESMETADMLLESTDKVLQLLKQSINNVKFWQVIAFISMAGFAASVIISFLSQ